MNNSTHFTGVAHDSSEEVLEVFTLFVIMAVAFSANVLAFTTIVTDRTLRRNPHNLLVVNLTVMDVGITCLSMPFSFISISDGGLVLESNPFICKANGFFASFFTFGNFSTVLFIAVDRYLAVVWASRFPTTRRRILIMMAVSWTLSLFVASAPLTERLSRYHYSSSTHHCSPAWMSCAFYVINFTFIYGMAVPTMLLSHAFIIYKLRSTEKKLRAYGAESSSGVPNSRSTGDGVITDSAQSKGEMSMEGKMSSDSVGMEIRESEIESPSTTTKELGTSSDEIDVQLDHAYSIPDITDQGRGERRTKDRQLTLAMKWRRLSVDKQVAVAGVLVVLTTVCCWAPYTIVHACFLDYTPSHVIGVVTMWLGYSNAMLDPLIYAFFNRQIRAKIVKNGRACCSRN